VERFYAPPLPLDALPPVDAVVLSHDHYDHLNEETIRALASRVPRFIAPLGLGAHLEYWGVPAENITELDWWERTSIDGLEIVSTPARHFSGRSLWDRNATLWSSWALIGAERRVFFSGDTGMFPGFETIGEELGPFDVTLLEIGAYDSTWSDIHMGPEQAVEAHRMVRGKLMLPIHWGTFNLAFHAWTEPAERVLAAAERAGVTVATPRPGESITPATPHSGQHWWPDLPWKTADEVPIVSSGMPAKEQGVGAQ
jgi:L-ascorbate metabolism protein UlaG (beta-lactamase superfamily)